MLELLLLLLLKLLLLKVLLLLLLLPVVLVWRHRLLVVRRQLLRRYWLLELLRRHWLLVLLFLLVLVMMDVRRRLPVRCPHILNESIKRSFFVTCYEIFFDSINHLARGFVLRFQGGCLRHLFRRRLRHVWYEAKRLMPCCKFSVVASHLHPEKTTTTLATTTVPATAIASTTTTVVRCRPHDLLVLRVSPPYVRAQLLQLIRWL
mmetsp:Transcript_44520/g.121342  ORF Transcript_44520/g.121342 Transcript_44520/m.121342 type:complete len:205 (+) Transcript_44520:202-816(+)